MRVLCLLQNIWGRESTPIVFKPNPLNKSAKVLQKICDGHTIYFANVASQGTPTAKGKPPIDAEHVEQVLDKLRHFDFLLVCGTHANTAMLDHFNKVKIPHLLIPHPAWRAFSNKLINEIKTNLNATYHEIH